MFAYPFYFPKADGSREVFFTAGAGLFRPAPVEKMRATPPNAKNVRS